MPIVRHRYSIKQFMLLKFDGGLFLDIFTLPQPEERATELFKYGLSQLGAGLGNLRKVFHPFVRPAGVDNSPGIHQGL